MIKALKLKIKANGQKNKIKHVVHGTVSFRFSSGLSFVKYVTFWLSFLYWYCINILTFHTNDSLDSQDLKHVNYCIHRLFEHPRTLYQLRTLPYWWGCMELSSQTNLGQEGISDGPVIQCKIVTYRLHGNGYLFGVLEYIIFLAILFCSTMVQAVLQLLSPRGNMQ